MTSTLTPVHRVNGVYVKRDDKAVFPGGRGGKARTCWSLSQGAHGLVTAGARQSPQAAIVAGVAQHLGIPCRVHMPQGKMLHQGLVARDRGAEIISHFPGYNSVLISRAKEDAAKRPGWTYIPFGMECQEAVRCTAEQVDNLPLDQIKRIVVPVGSGMSLIGILTGLRNHNQSMPVLGVQVGADPARRLRQFAPPMWQQNTTLVMPGMSYASHAEETMIGDIETDPVYEAKCLPFIEVGDLLWIVGIRD